MSDGPVYIASPFAGDVAANTAFAIECRRYAIRQGKTSIAPHLLYPQMLDDSHPADRAVGLALGHHILAVCKELWVCGSRISQGMESEIARAKELGIPIRTLQEL